MHVIPSLLLSRGVYLIFFLSSAHSLYLCEGVGSGVSSDRFDLKITQMYYQRFNLLA